MFERLVFKLVFKNKRLHKNLIPVDTNYDQSEFKKYSLNKFKTNKDMYSQCYKER